MILTDFSHDHIGEALILSKANYEEERGHVPVLPVVPTLPDLAGFVDNGLGVAAFESGRLVGFLCCYGPFDNAFTTNATGAFSPVHAHGVVNDNRAAIYRRLYQACAEKWVEEGIGSHAIGLYAHDTQAIGALYACGFGLRCMDAIRPMEEIDAPPCRDFAFGEVEKTDAGEIEQLRRLLYLHLGESPCFMQHSAQELDSWLARASSRNSRIFVARKDDVVTAFMEVMDSGETFATEASDMQNICGAYCLPEYRGQGVSQSLLNSMIGTLRSEGYTRLGVDFESFNLTASGFWLKYFAAYTHSVVRRIDENALGALPGQALAH